MMYLQKNFRFEAAHRLTNSYHKRCRGIHGHSYKVELELYGPVNEETGVIIDFARIKELFGSTIIDSFDHTLILSTEDPLAKYVPNQGHAFGSGEFSLDYLNPRWMLVPYEPTAEMMAAHLYWYWETRCYPRCGIRCSSVGVWETETSSADCSALMSEVNFEDVIMPPVPIVSGFDRPTGV